jgi:hypothetical protein
MQTITTIGLDTAKSVFQVHGKSLPGTVRRRDKVRQISRLPYQNSHSRSILRDNQNQNPRLSIALRHLRP